MMFGQDSKLELVKIVKFVFVGGSTFVLQTIIYFVLSRYVILKFDNFYSYILALMIAIIYNYIAHNYWTFKDSSRIIKSSIKRYVLVVLLAFLLNNFLFYLGDNILRIYDLLVLVLVNFLMMFFTYLVHRFYTFKSY